MGCKPKCTYLAVHVLLYYCEVVCIDADVGDEELRGSICFI